MKMPDPVMNMSEATPKTMPQATSKSMLPRALFAGAALALTFGIFASTAPAGAAPMHALRGLASPGLQVEEAGYRRAKRYRPFFGSDYYVAQGYDVRAYACCARQSDEIRELQRLFPSTNWPPSDRYYNRY
jgi:hypothetical protein